MGCKFSFYCKCNWFTKNCINPNFINNLIHNINMNEINIDLKDIDLDKVRDDVNLILYDSGFGGMEEMKLTNKLIEGLKHGKLQINFS